MTLSGVSSRFDLKNRQNNGFSDLLASSRGIGMHLKNGNLHPRAFG